MRRWVPSMVLCLALATAWRAAADDNPKPLPKNANKPIPLKSSGKSFRLYKSNQVKPLATPLNPLPKPGAKKPGKPKEKI